MSTKNSEHDEARIIKARDILRMDDDACRAFFEHAPVAMAAMDPDSGRILAVNEMSVQLFGYTHEEFIGKFPADLTYAGDAVIAGENFAQFRSDASGKAMVEKRYVRKDGSVFWAQAGVSLLQRGGKGDLLIGTAIDITRRKEAEQAWAESQAFYRMAGRSAKMGAWALDAATRQVRLSAEACDILAAPQGMAPGLDEYLGFFAAESRERLARAIARCTEEGGAFDDEFERDAAAGKRQTVRVLGEAVRDGRHAVIAVQGALQDISAIKAYDEALREQSASMRLFIEHAPAAIAMLDSGMRYMAVSRRWMEDYRLRGADILGKSHYEIFPEIPERWEAVHRRALAGEVVSAREDRFEREDGSVQWLNWEVRPWYTARGEVGGVVIFTEDVTRRKQDDIKLREQDALFRDMSSLAHVGGWQFDPATGMGSWTDEVARIHDLAPSAFVTAAFGLSFYQGEDRMRIEQAVREAITTGRPYDLDLELVSATGRHKRVRTMCDPVIENGKVVRMRGAIQDVTEHVAAQEQLRLWAEMFEKADFGLAITDATSNRFISVNAAYARARGYERSELEGQSADIVYRDPAAMEAMLARLAEQRHLVVEAEDIAKDGRIFPVELDITETTTRDGKPDKRIIYAVDISARKRLEEEVRRQDARYRSVIKSTTEGFWQVDARGRMLDVNEAYAAMSGFSREELLQMNVTDLEASESAAEVAAHIARLKQAGRDRFETLHRRKDGSTWPVEISVNYVPGTEEDLYFAFILDITERKHKEEIISAYARQLETSMEGTLLAISHMVEQRDPYTAGHERRVGIIAGDIARELGWDAAKCKQLALMGLVHDIGKIGVPVEILSKPGRLTDAEYELIKQHVETGYTILKDVEFPLPVAEIIHQHHERMDGSGYPRGLKGEEILPEARVLMVADVVEAIASHRPYRPALGLDIAIKEIAEKRGTYYDPAVADAFLRMVREQGYTLPQ